LILSTSLFSPPAPEKEVTNPISDLKVRSIWTSTACFWKKMSHLNPARISVGSHQLVRTLTGNICSDDERLVNVLVLLLGAQVDEVVLAMQCLELIRFHCSGFRSRQQQLAK
jgi:hypothetical protein